MGPHAGAGTAHRAALGRSRSARRDVDLPDGVPALGRGNLILVITDDGSSAWHERTRRSAIALAGSIGGRLLFYDRSAESRFADPYASGPFTADTQWSHGERVLGPDELHVLGRDYLIRDIEEAAERGVDAGAWLPKWVGARGIADAVSRFGCALVVVPAELGRRAVVDRPSPWGRPRPVVSVPVLVSGPDGSLRDWQLAAELSAVEFEVRQFGLLPVRGRFSEFEVGLDFDEVAPEATRVDARIVAASLTTGLGIRDRALRSEAFFDVAHHPEIGFASAEITHSGSAYRVVGDLTIKGRSRRVELRGEFHGIADAGGHHRATMRLTTEVDRRDWDLRGGFLVADRALLRINAIAVRAPRAIGRSEIGQSDGEAAT